jgi:RNA polymerase sigma-70 factor (ECF subfamily)
VSSRHLLGTIYDLAIAPELSPPEQDDVLVAALRAGDEAAFARLVDRYHGGMLRLARAYVSTAEAAEDVVQDAWIGVVRGIGRFEGRSSLKTWIYRIVINRAMTRGGRDARMVPFSSLGPSEPAVDPARFNDAGRWAGFWCSPPTGGDAPDQHVLSAEARRLVEDVIAVLPANQRLVITLRDIQGLSAPEACEVLGVSEANQRVLLHRARSKVRTALEGYLTERQEVVGR